MTGDRRDALLKRAEDYLLAATAAADLIRELARRPGALVETRISGEAAGVARLHQVLTTDALVLDDALEGAAELTADLVDGLVRVLGRPVGSAVARRIVARMDAADGQGAGPAGEGAA